MKSTQNKTNHFEIIMKSLYGPKLPQICAFIYYDFRGLPLFVNYSNICHLWHTVFFYKSSSFFTNIFTLYYNKNFENEMIVKFPTVLKIFFLQVPFVEKDSKKRAFNVNTFTTNWNNVCSIFFPKLELFRGSERYWFRQPF